MTSFNSLCSSSCLWKVTSWAHFSSSVIVQMFNTCPTVVLRSGNKMFRLLHTTITALLVFVRMGHWSLRGWILGYLRENIGFMLMWAYSLLICMQVMSKLVIWGVARTSTGFEPHTSRSPNNLCLLCEHGRSVPSQWRCSAVMANLFCCDFASCFRKVTDWQLLLQWNRYLAAGGWTTSHIANVKNAWRSPCSRRCSVPERHYCV